MEVIPFLIFAFIAFKVFSSFSKAASSEPGDTAKDMMKRLNAQMQQTGNAQNRPTNINEYMEKGPTARGRERLAMKNQNSPWDHEHDLGDDSGSWSPGAKVAANYLKTTKARRKASHKSPEQHGRRGKNMDQNKNRTDEWGERGDGGFLNGTTLVIFLVLGVAILYVLSNMPAK